MLFLICTLSSFRMIFPDKYAWDDNGYARSKYAFLAWHTQNKSASFQSVSVRPNTSFSKSDFNSILWGKFKLNFISKILTILELQFSFPQKGTSNINPLKPKLV
jgi:hypothetical protein